MNDNQPTYSVICLLPVRNAEADLSAFFESARVYCDAIIALDDGSTDATGEILAREPLVKLVLANPRRDDYRGWDDAQNRNRLLDAAAQFGPEWIISIDADERLDHADAVALRTFLETDALPGFAYGFRHVPMREDEKHFVPKYQWVYRLFSYSPGLQFPDQRLHFIPIPTAIPRKCWIKTTLRIQHFGGATSTRRLARYRKYLEADPERQFQDRYSPLLQSNVDGQLRLWQSRPEGMDILLASAQASMQPEDLEGQTERKIALSAIVIAQNDEATILESIEAIVNQECDEPFEVILVTSGTDRTASVVRDAFPDVNIIELTRPALPGEARNAGLQIAKGTIVTFPGSHVIIRPGNLAARLQSHRKGYAMVTGLVENGTFTPAGWASYFLDHAEEMPGSPGAVLQGPPGHCSYSRLPLLEVGGFPEAMRTAEDTLINRDLVRRGYVAFRDARVQFVHRSPNTTWNRLLKHHFRRGKGWGRLVVMDHEEKGNLLNRELLRNRLVRHIPDRLQRIARGVERGSPELRDQFRQVRPGIVIGVVASWLGMWSEIARPGRGKLSILIGQPRQTVFVGIDGAQVSASLIEIDRVNMTSRSTLLPISLELQREGSPSETLGAFISRRNAQQHTDADSASIQQSVTEALAETFDIDQLDYLIVSEDVLRAAADSKTAPSTTSLRRKLAPVVNIAKSLSLEQSGQIRTSLKPWQVPDVIEAMKSGAISLESQVRSDGTDSGT